MKKVQTKTTFQKIYFYVSLIIVLSLFVLIFCLSHQSGEESTETSGWFTSLLNFIFPFELTEDFVRTMAHFSEFACLSFFMNNLFVSYKEKLTPVFACALSFFYAITDEIHQIFVPGRACQFLDMMVDLAGIVSGMFVFTILYLLTNKLINKKVLSAEC
ncbi:MAG: VanZ family protein [Ruminococcaceae bacterium]|nr:VanZ family protein [Oscillospiraceae bacterium]